MMDNSPAPRTESERIFSLESQIENLSKQVNRLNTNLENVRRLVADSTYNSREHLNSIQSLLKVTRDSLPSEIVELAALREFLVGTDVQMPSLGGWPLGASTTTKVCRGLLNGEYRGDILELGGGASTVWIAETLRRIGSHQKFISVDHDEFFLSKTAKAIAEHGLNNYVELIHAPIALTSFLTTPQQWYSIDKLAELKDIGLLIIDGPPGSTNVDARLPSLYFAESRLADHAWILLDDYNRPDEKRISENWIDNISGLSVDSQVGDTQILKFQKPVGRK